MSVPYRGGTPEEEWLRAPAWTKVPALVLADLDCLVVVSAHPGDESLAAAGLMARAASLAVPVHVVVAANGMERSPSSRSAVVSATGRKEALVSALDVVAPGAMVDLLELPDAELRWHAEEFSAHLESLAIRERTLVVAPWRQDGEGDHESMGAVAAATAKIAGAQLLEYPVWMWHRARPTDDDVPWARFVTLALTDAERAAKSQVIASRVHHESPPAADEVEVEVIQDYFERPFEVFITPPGIPIVDRGESG